MAKVETERFFGKKGIIIMMRDGNSMVSAIFKDKKNADKFNRNNPADVKKLLQLAKKTKFPKAIDEGQKRYNQKDGVGKSKYVISYHDGKKKHKDGSDFFDIQTFRNKKDLAKFVNALHKGGYKYGFGESVNEASKEAMGIAAFTGTRGAFVDDFIKKHNIDARKLFNFVRKGNLRDRMDFVTAVAGKPNNKFFKMIVGRFAESVNEAVSEGDLLDALDRIDAGLDEADYGFYALGRLKGVSSREKAKLKGVVKEFEKLKKSVSSIYKSVKFESVNEAFLVAYGKGPKPMKPAFAAYADKKMAQKFMADMKKDGYKVMMTQKKIRGIDESKTKESKAVQVMSKYSKTEKKFYDKMAEHERRIGPRDYKKFIDKALRGFGENPNKYKTVPDAEEKLYNLTK